MAKHAGHISFELFLINFSHQEGDPDHGGKSQIIDDFIFPTYVELCTRHAKLLFQSDFSCQSCRRYIVAIQIIHNIHDNEHRQQSVFSSSEDEQLVKRGTERNQPQIDPKQVSKGIWKSGGVANLRNNLASICFSSSGVKLASEAGNSMPCIPSAPSMAPPLFSMYTTRSPALSSPESGSLCSREVIFANESTV